MAVPEPGKSSGKTLPEEAALSLSTIVVTWNSEAFIDDCLESLLLNGPIDHQVIVVDNASSDETVKHVEAFPEVLLVKNNENMGLGYATCQAEKLARHDLVMISNPDMSYNPSLLELVQYAEQHPEYATFGPSLNPNEKGTYGKNPPRFHRFPFLLGFSFGRALDNNLNHFLTRLYLAIPKNRWKGLRADKDDKHVFGASCMMLRRSCIEKIGGIYREKYFLYWADADMGMRLAKYSIVGTAVPQINFDHYGGYCRKKMSEAWASYLTGRGQGQFEKDWGHWTRITVLWIMDTVFAALAGKVRLRRPGLQLRIAYLKGWFSAS